MWETLDSCIKEVDAESLNKLIPRLAHLVRSSVGLNTSSVLKLLSHISFALFLRLNGLESFRYHILP